MVNEYEDLKLPPPPQFRDGCKPAPRTNETIKKPVPKQRKIVKQMVNEYEDLILPPPPQFKDGYKPVSAPRSDRPLQIRENQNAQKPPKPQRSPPPPPKKEHEDPIIYPLYNSGMTNHFKNQFLLQQLRIKHLR